MKALQSTLALCVLLAACSGNKTNEPTASNPPAGSTPSEAANQKKAMVRFAQTIPGEERDHEQQQDDQDTDADSDAFGYADACALRHMRG